MTICQLPAGAPALVHCSHSKEWEGPFKFIQIDGKTVVVQTRRGRKLFCSSCVKPFTNTSEDLLETIDIGEKYALDNETGTSVENRNAKALALLHDMEHVAKRRKKPNDDIINNVNEFHQSRMEEVECLLKNSTFKLVDVDDIIEGTRIFGSRLIVTVKSVNSGVRYKVRLLAQNYGDRDAATIATKAPTV